MTCIVALVESRVIWMGADSSATNKQGGKLTLENRKIFGKRDPKGTLWMIGYAGDYREGQIAEVKMELPSITVASKDNLYRFLVSEFVTSYQNYLRQGGALPDGKGGRKDKSSGALIIGINGEIFVVDEEFAVQIPHYPYISIGSGDTVAISSMASTKGLLEPQERILVALEQAQELDTNVSDPFLIMNSKEAEENVRYVRSRRKSKR